MKKIEHKIYFSNAVHIMLLLLIGIVALHNLNELYTKFRFITIADELNDGFLGMRLAEKNYFLYGDQSALGEIRMKIEETTVTLSQVKDDIIRAVGSDNYNKLEDLLNKYGRMITLIIQQGAKDQIASKQLREVGQELKKFSDGITSLERANVDRIIKRSKKILHLSFWTIVLFALFFSQQIVRNISRSLHQIVALTQTISKGNYQLVDKKPSEDEMGAVAQQGSSEYGNGLFCWVVSCRSQENPETAPVYR